ncbi:unnamed protein product [Owenia fusiformis]|uniref:VWFA domain-containing protein n=1 Tax=Owenia fusiformis TaxID=6347 RepID=A0A8S4Q282_OWEFU|nr:unnamed protein product [Owenia fusiformis]
MRRVAICLIAVILGFAGIDANDERACGLDLVLAIDTSCSFITEDKIKMKQFIIKFVEYINDIGPALRQTQIGILTYNQITTARFFLVDSKDLATPLARIKEIPMNLEKEEGCKTKTNQALEMARTDFFQESKGDRMTNANVLTIITDGVTIPKKLFKQTLKESDLNKKDGIEMFVIGVYGDKTKNVNTEEWNNMATDPTDWHVITINGTSGLSYSLEAIVRRKMTVACFHRPPVDDPWLYPNATSKTAPKTTTQITTNPTTTTMPTINTVTTVNQTSTNPTTTTTTLNQITTKHIAKTIKVTTPTKTIPTKSKTTLDISTTDSTTMITTPSRTTPKLMKHQCQGTKECKKLLGANYNCTNFMCVRGDPHIQQLVKGTDDPICYDLFGKPGQVYEFLTELSTGTFVTGVFIEGSNIVKSGELAKYIGEIVVKTNNLTVHVTVVDILLQRHANGTHTRVIRKWKRDTLSLQTVEKRGTMIKIYKSSMHVHIEDVVTIYISRHPKHLDFVIGELNKLAHLKVGGIMGVVSSMGYFVRTRFENKGIVHVGEFSVTVQWDHARKCWAVPKDATGFDELLKSFAKECLIRR